MSVDTSREAVERLAFHSDLAERPKTAATLRALLAERDAAKALADQWCDQAQKMAAERDAARAEVARLRGAVEALIAADDHWLKGNKGGEWAHRMSIAREVARAALAGGKHE